MAKFIIDKLLWVPCARISTHLHESFGTTFSLRIWAVKLECFPNILPLYYGRGCEAAGAPPTSPTNARGFYTLPSLFPQNTNLQFSASAELITGAVPALYSTYHTFCPAFSFNLTKYCSVNLHLSWVSVSVADSDPGSCDFMTSGPGIRDE